MADINVTRKASGQFTWVWAVLAIVAIAGLMYWLSTQQGTSGPTAAADADSAGAAEATPAAGGAEAVELPALAGNPDSFAGRPLALSAVTVAATLGPRVFWADVPGQNPFLVVVAPDAGAPALASGQTVNLEGTVNTVDEAAVSSWAGEGALNPGAEGEASFATHYLMANRVTTQ